MLGRQLESEYEMQLSHWTGFYTSHAILGKLAECILWEWSLGDEEVRFVVSEKCWLLSDGTVFDKPKQGVIRIADSSGLGQDESTAWRDYFIANQMESLPFQINKEIGVFWEWRDDASGMSADERMAKTCAVLSLFGNPSENYTDAALEYLWNRNEITRENFEKLYLLVTESNNEEAIRMLKAHAIGDDESQDKYFDGDKWIPVTHKVELLCAQHFTPYFINGYAQDKGIDESHFRGVRFRESGNPVPPYLVKCALVPYLEQKNYSGYTLNNFADRIAEAFDPTSFQTVLDDLLKANLELTWKVVIPYFRFSSGSQLSKLFNNKNKEFEPARSKNAIVLNESTDAFLLADKWNLVHEMARIRGQSEDEYRSARLFHLGLSQEGSITYDLASLSIEARLGKNLKFTLYDLRSGRSVRNFPKKGVDKELLQGALEHYSDLQKMVGNAVNKETTILENRFIDGIREDARHWKEKMLNHPIRSIMTHLVVWEHLVDEEIRSFVNTDNGFILQDGSLYNLSDEGQIRMAHPAEMGNEYLETWRSYFVAKNLHQPFRQLWESFVQLDAEALGEQLDQWVLATEAFTSLNSYGFRMTERRTSWRIKHRIGGFAAKLLPYTNQGDRDNKETSGNQTEAWTLREIQVDGSPRDCSRLLLMLASHFESLKYLVDRDDYRLIEILETLPLELIEKLHYYAIENGKADAASRILEHRQGRLDSQPGLSAMQFRDARDYDLGVNATSLCPIADVVACPRIAGYACP